MNYRSVRSNERLNGSGLIRGGFTGLWTALLAKESDPERSVVLVEGHRVGWAASGRNGGFCGASLIHELTRLKVVKAKPVPFPPEPLAYLGIQPPAGPWPRPTAAPTAAPAAGTCGAAPWARLARAFDSWGFYHERIRSCPD